MYTTIGTYYFFRLLSVVLLGLEQSNQHNCCIRTVVPPDDGPRYARNM